MWLSLLARLLSSAIRSSSRGVRLGPGQIALARMPRRAYWTAISQSHRKHSALARGVRDLWRGGPHQSDERGDVDQRAVAVGLQH